MSNCPGCKQPLVEDARFCPNCGVNIPAPLTEATPAPTAPVQENPYQVSSAVIDDRPLAAPPAEGVGEYDRQFGASACIGEAFNIWSENLPRMVLLNLIPVVPILIISIIMVVMVIGLISTAGGSFGNMDPSQWPSMLGALGVGTVVGFAFLLLAMMLVTIPAMAGQFRLMDEHEKNQPPTNLFTIYFWAARFILPIVGLFIMAYLVMGGLTLPAILPFIGLSGASGGAMAAAGGMVFLYVMVVGFGGTLVMARLVCTLPLMVIEGKPLFAALAASNEMVKGHTWTIVGSMGLFFLVLMGLSIVVGLLGMIPLIGQLVNLAFNLVFPPLQMAYGFAIYAGLKTRQHIQDAAY